MNCSPKKSLNNSSIIENSFFGQSCNSSSSRIIKIQKPFLSKIKIMCKNNSSTTIQTYNSLFGKNETKKIKLNKKIHRIISELRDNTTPRKNTQLLSSKTNHSLLSIKEKHVTTQEMIDKYINGTRNVYRKDLNPAQINRKNFKQLLIRDFGLVREDDVQKDQIERSKMMYYKENEFNEKKKTIRIKKSISMSDMCKKSLDHYYTHRIMTKKERSLSIANEIRELDCGGYQTVKHKNSNCLTKFVNYHNLNRKIKVHNIEKYTYDLESDDLGIRNLSKLKSDIKKVSIEAMKYTSRVTPKFIKGKVKPETIKKYRSLLGLFFGLG